MGSLPWQPVDDEVLIDDEQRAPVRRSPCDGRVSDAPASASLIFDNIGAAELTEPSCQQTGDKVVRCAGRIGDYNLRERT